MAQQTQSGFVLEEGEQLVRELEMEFFAQSSNPIAQLLGTIQRLIYAILGIKFKGFLLITNKRVVIIKWDIYCYCFKTAKDVTIVLPANILQVGYFMKKVCGLFCPAYRLFYTAHVGSKNMLLKDADEAEATKIVAEFYRALTASQN